MVLLVILGSIGLWYVNEYIMPTKGKALVLDYLVKATGREVALGGIYYNPFRGIILRDLTVSDDPKYARKFLEIRKLYLNILYLPLLQDKKLVVSSVRIESPRIYITIDDKNEWNFGSLLFLKDMKPDDQAKVLVNSISISGGSCVFEDLATEPDFKKEFRDMVFSASLSYPLKVKYRMSSDLDITRKSSMSADGEFVPASRNTTLNLKLKNVPLEEFKPYYSGMPFNSLSGNLSGNISAAFSPENSLTVAAMTSVNSLDLVRDDLTAKGGIDLSGKMTVDLKDKAKLKMPCVVTASAKMGKLDLASKDFAVKGGADANGKFVFDLKDKAVPLKYTADTLLRDTKISGVPAFGSIDRINGKIYFDETKLWTDLLKGLAKGFDCVFSGSIKDYNNPYLTLTAKTDLDLARLGELLPLETKEKLKGYAFSGIGKIALNVNGPLKEQAKVPLAYTIASELLDCSIKPDFLDKPIKSINGNLSIKGESLTLRNISGFFDDKKYLLSGDVAGFRTPACDLSLSSDDLKLKAVFKSLENSIIFSKFDGKYRESVFNLAGSFSEFKDPALDIRGTLNTKLSELAAYIPKESRILFDKLDPRTAVSTAFKFKGKAKEQSTWQVTLDRLSAKSDTEEMLVLGTINDLKDPTIDIRGSLKTGINELKKFLSKEQAALLDKNEIGAESISSKFAFQGRQKDMGSWKADLVADSPVLIVKKLKFNSCHLEGKFKDRYITVSRLTAEPYDGTLAANAVFDLNKADTQYVVQIGVRNIDIARWKDDTDMKDKKLSGRFSANADLGGFMNDINTLKGNGKFQIADGKFWELPVFSGLANILYIPGVSKIAFGQAQGSFTIANRNIHTEDTQLNSEQMNLNGVGNVDFDGNLNFQVTAAFDKGLLQVPSSLGPFRDLFIDKEGNYLGDIKVDGTTKEPKYKINSPFNNILKNKLFDNIKKGLFGGNSE
ncbi:MAG: DUF748 domain-containing protein [Candidatus Omnitrophica bacterium]|nr:DUF748 domain-containing protein [Candidatus Omnitrophota bacterium]